MKVSKILDMAGFQTRAVLKTARVFGLLLLTACTTTGIPFAPTATPLPTETPVPASPTSNPPAFGAGFRYSTYGPGYDPGPEYWVKVGQEMAAKFPGSVPQTIWIVGNVGVRGSSLTFPGLTDVPNIYFSSKDNNEEALTLFDQLGMQAWLQVEPGHAPMETLIDIVLEKYGHHPSVIGMGVDVEWYKSTDTPEGEAVTDEDAAAWLATIRKHNPNYRLFLKHWEQGKMPPTLRDGLVFVDDSQQFDSLEAMVAEFAQWGRDFAPAPVAFQYGYYADRKWWKELADPPADIGRAILEATPNTEALFWVDFTAREVFPP